MTAKLVLNDDPYSYDVHRIVSICSNYGYEIDCKTAKQAWTKHSVSAGGSWLTLPKEDQYIIDYILLYTKEIQTE